jgi:gas vesicle protein
MSGICSVFVERVMVRPRVRWHVTCSKNTEINVSLKEEPAMYEPHYEEEAGGGGFLIGLLCGTALGAAIGLMFAPKAGSEFRQRLYESTGDIRRKAYETYDQASEQVNNMVSKGRQAVDRGREAFENARQSASGQTASGNGSTSDFGGQNRTGVSDFNAGTRTTGGV